MNQKKTIILLMRHGEGTHLTGEFSEKKHGNIGPQLTGKWIEKEKRWSGGKGQSYRRTLRQLNELKLTPSLILVSPQLRALETAAFARLNEEEYLADGKTLLKEVPVKILTGPHSIHEQTRMLDGQGSILPSLENASKNWPNYKILNEDTVLWEAITNSLKEKTQPGNDPNGTAVPRAKRILEHLGSDKYKKEKCILVVAHDGICRDLIYAKNNRRTPIFGLCEIRYLDPPRQKSKQKKTTKKRKRCKK